MKKKLSKFNKVPIYFDDRDNLFSCEYQGKEYQNKDLSELKSLLEKLTIESFEGEYFTKDYDGINKFEAKSKWQDSYLQKTRVVGFQIDQYGHKRETRIALEELYPKNTYNQKLYKEARRLIEEGWHLIRQGQNLARGLKK